MDDKIRDYFAAGQKIISDDLKRKGIPISSTEDIVRQVSAFVRAFDLLDAQDRGAAADMWELAEPFIQRTLDSYGLPCVEKFFPNPNKQVAARAVLVKRGHRTKFDYLPIFETYRDRADAILMEALDDTQ